MMYDFTSCLYYTKIIDQQFKSNKALSKKSLQHAILALSHVALVIFFLAKIQTKEWLKWMIVVLHSLCAVFHGVTAYRMSITIKVEENVQKKPDPPVDLSAEPLVHVCVDSSVEPRADPSVEPRVDPSVEPRVNVCADISVDVIVHAPADPSVDSESDHAIDLE
ncbi:unnamed protein product [Rotaria sp. Silwood2]|nr:unnamed protein product [Rotaria sp. Silwood2]